jgi:hypothetical protein
MTNGQSASLSWNKAPIWFLGLDSYYSLTVVGLLMWGALSDERMDLSFTIAAGLASAVFHGSKSHGTCNHILLSQIRDLLFVVSNLRGYSGGIRPHFHRGGLA